MSLEKLSKHVSYPFLRLTGIAILVLTLVVSLQYVVLSVMSVRKYINAIYQEEDVRLLTPATEPDSAYFAVYKERTWLETRYQISQTDSISLSVNLKDSLLQLELKGVVLKSTKLLDFQCDQLLGQLRSGAYHHFFGVQAKGLEHLSTIEKVPLVVKMAPKDTAEFNRQSQVKEIAKPEAVHWVMQLDNDIELRIEGTNSESRSDWWRGQQFWWKQDMRKLGTKLKSTARFRVPDYQPSISLVISESDAKAIYRALPVYPLVAIRL